MFLVNQEAFGFGSCSLFEDGVFPFDLTGTCLYMVCDSLEMVVD